MSCLITSGPLLDIWVLISQFALMTLSFSLSLVIKPVFDGMPVQVKRRRICRPSFICFKHGMMAQFR